MEKKIEKKDGNLVIDTVFDEKEFDEVLKVAEENLAKEITVPGFRKGKADVDLARRYFKESDLSNHMIRVFLRRIDKSNAKEKIFETYKVMNIQPTADIVKFEKNATEIKVTYTLYSELTKLGQYKGVKTDVKKKDITDEDIDAELKRLAKDNEELVSVEREAKIGDVANIDFIGYLNGKAFEGGDGKNFDLTLGSNHFVPGFEDQVVSHKAGDKFDINLVMPENYPQELANKEVVFKVTVNTVKESQLPNIDDEFATTLSGEYVSKDLAELKEKIKNKLVAQSENDYFHDLANSYLISCRDSSEYEISENYVKLLVEDRIKRDTKDIEDKGLSLQEYLKLINQSYDDYQKSVKDNVIAEIKNNLVYQKIAEAEKIPPVSNEEIEKVIGSKIEDFVKNYTEYLKLSKVKEDVISYQINSYLGQVYNNIFQQKVIDKVLILNGDKKEEKAEEKKEEKKENLQADKYPVENKKD